MEWQRSIARILNWVDERFDRLQYVSKGERIRRDKLVIIPYLGFGTSNFIFMKGRVVEEKGILRGCKGGGVIKVLLFGSFSTIAGCREINLGPEAGVRALSDIVALVEEKYLKKKAGSYMLTLNGAQAKPSVAVKDGDEVAIMPPFSGG